MDTAQVKNKQFIMYPILVLALTATAWMFGFLSSVTLFMLLLKSMTVWRLLTLLGGTFLLLLPFVPLFLYELYRFKKYWASFLLPGTFLSIAFACFIRTIYLFPFYALKTLKLTFLFQSLMRQPTIIGYFLLSISCLIACFFAFIRVYPRFFTVIPLIVGIVHGIATLFIRPLTPLLRYHDPISFRWFFLVINTFFYSGCIILLAVSLLMICLNKDAFKRAPKKPKKDKNALPPLTLSQELKEIKDYYDRGILSEEEYTAKKNDLQAKIIENKKKKPAQ